MGNVNEILMSEDESVVATLGGSYLRNFLATGEITSGFSVISDKRVYFKGRLFKKDAPDKFFKLKKSEYTVDLEDVTGTTIHSTNPIILKILYILALLLIPVALIVGASTIPYGHGNEDLDAELLSVAALLAIVDMVLNYIHTKSTPKSLLNRNVLIIGATVIVWFIAMLTDNEWIYDAQLYYISKALPFVAIHFVARLLYILTTQKKFIVQYAGGEIQFPMNKYPEEEIKEYERQLRLSKDRAKQNQSNKVEQPVKNQIAGSNSIADELIKYKSLLESGAITVEEYEAIKNKLLNGVG